MPGSLDALTPEQQPPWLTAAIDQRLALMKDIMGPVAYAAAKQMGILMTPLTEPSEFATPEVFARWDHSCDNCGKHCVGSELLHYGNVMLEDHDQFDGRVVVTFGACSECATWVH